MSKLSKGHDILADALGLPGDLTEPDEVFEVAKAEPLTFATDDYVKDYETARQNSYDLLAKGTQAIELLMVKAAASDASRPFEVLAGLIKTMAEINGQLLDIHTKYNKLKADAGHKGSSGDSDDEDDVIDMPITTLLEKAKTKS